MSYRTTLEKGAKEKSVREAEFTIDKFTLKFMKVDKGSKFDIVPIITVAGSNHTPFVGNVLGMFKNRPKDIEARAEGCNCPYYSAPSNWVFNMDETACMILKITENNLKTAIEVFKNHLDWGFYGYSIEKKSRSDK